MWYEVDISKRCKEVLLEVGDEEIARYCYEHGMMTKEQAVKVIGDEERLDKHGIHYCNIGVNIDDVLDEIDDSDLYDTLCARDYIFPKVGEDKLLSEMDKDEFLNTMRKHFSKKFTKVFTKEDFKRELMKAIDDYMIV